MHDGGYPAGAEFASDAPWNEKTNDPISVEVEVTCYMRKRFVITTDRYKLDEEGCIEEYDDLFEEAKDRLEIPTGWELVEVEDVEEV